MAKQKASPARSRKTKSKKPTLLQSITRRKMILIPLLIAAFVGSFGVWQTMFSNAATYDNLYYKHCYVRGRAYPSTGNCARTCVSGAGYLKYNSRIGYYCSYAVSSISSTTCASKGRVWLPETGCARWWGQTTRSGALQCKYNFDRYSNNSGPYVYRIASYDYCTAPTTSGSGGTTVGSGSPVGGGYNGAQNCVSFMNWVLPRHVTGFSTVYANGIDYARVLRSRGWSSKKAVHSVVSMTASSSAGHVALIYKVYSDGAVAVEESNYGKYYGTRYVSASELSSKGANYAYPPNWH